MESKAPKRKGRKRRHPDALLVENSKALSSSDESRPSSPSSRRKRNKEWQSILPKSEIRTRGAKLPNFSLHLKIRPSRKEQRAIESSSIRSSIGYSEAILTKSGAKKGRRELPPAFNMNDFPKPPPPIRKISLTSNPEHWSSYDTARFLAQTSDCAHLARFIVEEDIGKISFFIISGIFFVKLKLNHYFFRRTSLYAIELSNGERVLEAENVDCHQPLSSYRKRDFSTQINHVRF